MFLSLPLFHKVKEIGHIVYINGWSVLLIVLGLYYTLGSRCLVSASTR